MKEIIEVPTFSQAETELLEKARGCMEWHDAILTWASMFLEYQKRKEVKG